MLRIASLWVLVVKLFTTWWTSYMGRSDKLSLSSVEKSELLSLPIFNINVEHKFVPLILSSYCCCLLLARKLFSFRSYRKISTFETAKKKTLDQVNNSSITFHSTIFIANTDNCIPINVDCYSILLRTNLSK